MKKFVIIFYLFLISLCVSAQNESSISHTKTVNDSTLIKIHAIVEDIDFRMHGLDRYKLYPTENIYNFLQLDTMMENPLKVVPLIHSNLTPVKFSHSPFCLFLFSSYSSCPLCRVLH